MTLIIVLFCIFIGWAQCQQPYYFINIPNSLTTDVDYHFSVFSSENIKIQIDSTEKRTDSTIIGEKYVIKAGESFSIPYTVQFVNIDEITLKIRADNGTIDKLKSQKEIRGNFIDKTVIIPIHKRGDIIFGETSQPLYNPGDLVKFRIFALHFIELKASRQLVDQWEVKRVNGKYVKKSFKKSAVYAFSSIAVIDPNGQNMSVWNNVNMTTAMSMSYQLLKDTVVGKWKIMVQLDSIEENFSFIVRKFVLPRYVVKIDPPYPLFSDKFVKFPVCSTYSTGKLMKATIQGKLCIMYGQRVINCRFFLEHLVGTKKCVEIKIKTKKLVQFDGYYPYHFQDKIMINVTVTEAGTDFSVFKSVTGRAFSRKPYTITWLSNEYFKPGLPYFGKIKLTKINGEPQMNESVYIGIRYPYQLSFETISDENGMLNFLINDLKSRNQIYLYLRSQNYRSPMENVHYRRYLKPWKSIQKKYIDILKTDELLTNSSDITCPGTINVSVVTNMDQDDTMNPSNIYVNVIGRGQLQSSRVQIFNFEPVKSCVSRDDYLGHYECLGNGDIKCLDGWTGDDCRDILCNEGCFNGVCISQYQCKCNHYWRGSSCNECIPRWGCQNGYCVRGNDCICYPGWRSYYCNYRSPNHKDPFRNSETSSPTQTVAPSRNNSIQKQTLFQQELTINIPVSSGPEVHIIVYMLTKKGEVISDRIVIKLNNCVVKSPKFEFVNGDVQIPGANITLKLETGTKQKSCAVTINDVAIDQFGSSSTMDLNRLINDLKHLNNELIRTRNTQRSSANKRCRETSKHDTHSAFQKSGITVISNLKLKYCLRYHKRRYIWRDRSHVHGTHYLHYQRVKTKILDYFPANWIFNYYTDAPTYLNYTVPDSITTWRVNSFCFTEQGLYLSPTKYMKVISQFYADVYLPYSIKLKEKLEVPVKVFNYLNYSYAIVISLQLNRKEIKIYSSFMSMFCICAQKIKRITFKIEPLVISDDVNITISVQSLNNFDCSFDCNTPYRYMVEKRIVIRRTLRVEAPGVQHELTLTKLICSRKDEKAIKIDGFSGLPSNVHPGSLRTYVSIVGNVLGTSLNNLENLMVQPTGCGEQRMAKIVSNIYVLLYLSSIENYKYNENKSVIDSALNYVQRSVIVQEEFKMNDGSYIAFRGSRSNTWLTAFVVRSYSALAQLVTGLIPPLTLQKSVDYIASTQNITDGFFMEYGRLISQNFAGKSEDGRSGTDSGLLTSYVLISIGIASSLVETSKINVPAALNYIREDLKRQNETSDFRLALAAYAHVLNDKESVHTKKMIDDLANAAQFKNQYKFWRRNKKQINYGDIEATGYAVLALTKAGYSSSLWNAIKWLMSHMSSRGSFRTTQTTAVALHAISEFFRQIEVIKTRELTVEVMLNTLNSKASETNKIHSVKFTENNQLAMHKWQVPPIYNSKTNVTITAKGEGCAVVQFVSKYTILNERPNIVGNETFKISANVNCMSYRKATIYVCSEYLRKDKDYVGMVIAIVYLHSGWRVSWEIQKDLVNQTKEIKELYNIGFSSSNSQVNLYYKGFRYQDAEQEKKHCFVIPIYQSHRVYYGQSAYVSIADYYKPHISVTARYNNYC